MSAIAATVPRRSLRLVSAALLDQILFAAGALAASVLLARWLPEAQYGAFAVAFTTLLLVGTFHNAVLTEPLLVFGATIYRSALRRYVGILLGLHLAFSAALAVALLVAAAILSAAGADTAAKAFAALAFAAPAQLLLVLLRRTFYVTRETSWAAAAGAVQLALTVAGLAGLAALDLASPASALLVIGGGSAGAAGFLLVKLRPQLRPAPGPRFREVAREHWRYGSWNVVAQTLLWTSGQVVLVLIPLVLGLEEAALVAAVMNVFRPLHPVQQSAVALLLPAASDLAARHESELLRRRAHRFLALFAGASAGYGLLVTLTAGPLMHHLYAGRYDGASRLVALVALVYVISTAVQVNAVLLKATGNVRLVPLVWALPGAVTLALGIPGLLFWGVEGGFAVVALAYAIAAVVGWSRARSVL